MNITYLNSDDQDKLLLLDKAFNILTAKDIEDFLSQDFVIGRLKGIPDKSGVLTSLVLDNANQDIIITNLQHESLTLRGEIMALKADMITMIKYINDRFQGYNSVQSDFNSMKSRHGIY